MCSVVDWYGVVINLLINLVFVYYKDNFEVKIMIYVLLDDVSDIIFITINVKEKFGIFGMNSKFIFSIMFGKEEIFVFRVDGLVVERID